MSSAAVASLPFPAPKPQSEVFESHKNIPGKFYHLPEVYAKEQRTTFSTSWLFLTHIGRVLRASKGEIPEAIEYEGHRAVYEAEVEWSGKKKPALVFEIAGFKFALRGSEVDGKPVVEGQLLNSPLLEAQLDRPINIHITSPGGWVFANLAEPGVEVVSAKEYLGGLEENQFADIKWDEYDFDGEFILGGRFNWKAYVDNFQECLHCPYGHAVTFSSYALQTYKVVNDGNVSQHFCARKDELIKKREEQGRQEGLGSSEGMWLFFFPNASFSAYAPAISTSIICPISPSETILHYQAFTHKSCTPETKAAFYKSIREVLAEDCELTEGSQRNYEVGVWSQGQLHPGRENGVLWFQQKDGDLKAWFVRRKLTV